MSYRLLRPTIPTLSSRSTYDRYRPILLKNSVAAEVGDGQQGRRKGRGDGPQLDGFVVSAFAERFLSAFEVLDHAGCLRAGAASRIPGGG